MLERNAIGHPGSEFPGAVTRALAPLPRQRGVALAIVVWFIAGMSVLVAGTVLHARVDTKMAQLHVAKAKAVAAGDGAIQLMLAEHSLPGAPASGTSGTFTSKYRLGSTEALVTLYPVSGFINLNTAPQEVLAALFLIVGQVPEDEANFLADNVVKWRGGQLGPDAAKVQAKEFQAIEDLLRVNGVSRTLLDAVRDFIVAGKWGASTTDWAVAPQELLQVLEQAMPEELDSNRAQRGAGDGVQAEARPLSGIYRADALVAYGDQTWLRRRWVSSVAAPGSALPWRVMRTEPPRVYER